MAAKLIVANAMLALTAVACSASERDLDSEIAVDPRSVPECVEAIGPLGPVTDAAAVTSAFDRDDAGLCLGPAALDESTLESVEVSLGQDGQASVALVFREGPEGIDLFNEVAARCFGADPACPERRLAILVDGDVVMAPTIQAPSFERDAIQIAGTEDLDVFVLAEQMTETLTNDDSQTLFRPVLLTVPATAADEN